MLTPTIIVSFTQKGLLYQCKFQADNCQFEKGNPVQKPQASVLIVAGIIMTGVIIFVYDLIRVRPPWHIDFFLNRDLDGVPKTSWASVVAFNWGTTPPMEGVPADNFSARFSTCLTVKTATDFTFTLGSDDGSRLLVGSDKVIEDWSNHAYREQTATRRLEPGLYPINIEYYEGDTDASIIFKIVPNPTSNGDSTITPPNQERSC